MQTEFRKIIDEYDSYDEFSAPQKYKASVYAVRFYRKWSKKCGDAKLNKIPEAIKACANNAMYSMGILPPF